MVIVVVDRSPLLIVLNMKMFRHLVSHFRRPKGIKSLWNHDNYFKRLMVVGKHHKPSYKPPTMDDLPVPAGSWARRHRHQQRKHNRDLVLGIAFTGFTAFCTVQSDAFDVFSRRKVYEMVVSKGKVKSGVLPSTDEGVEPGIDSSSFTPGMASLPTEEESPTASLPQKESPIAGEALKESPSATAPSTESPSIVPSTESPSITIVPSTESPIIIVPSEKPPVIVVSPEKSSVMIAPSDEPLPSTGAPVTFGKGRTLHFSRGRSAFRRCRNTSSNVTLAVFILVNFKETFAVLLPG